MGKNTAALTRVAIPVENPAETIHVSPPTPGTETTDFKELLLLEQEDWTDFRHLPRLCRRAGVPMGHLRRLVVKELTDNQLDEAAPGTVVRALHDGTYVVEGPGRGMAPEQIRDLFSIRRPRRSSKLFRMPTRGCLGNGLRVVAGAVLASDGTLEIWSRNQHHTVYPQHSGETILSSEAADYPDGMKVAIRLGAAIPPDIDALSWAKVAKDLAVGTCYKGKPSARWFDSDTFYDLALSHGERTVREFIAELDGCTGTKAGEIAAPWKNRQARSLTREEADAVLAAVRGHSAPVRHKRLGQVGTDAFPDHAYARHDGVLTERAARGGHEAEIPFVIEVWARAADPPDDTITLAINRTPSTAPLTLTRRSNRKQDAVLQGCELRHWAEVGTHPISIVVNFTTPYMPMTSDGKAPDLEIFAVPLLGVVRQAARKARRKLPAGQKPPVEKPPTLKQAVLDLFTGAVNKLSQGGTRYFRDRDLYYDIRDEVKQRCGSALSQDYMDRVLAEHEQETDTRIAKRLRDSRGTLYTPHGRGAIPLGTLEIETFRRPVWTYNKAILVEKEGFLDILRVEGWGERNDCALLTSKGFASGAVKDLLDLFGEGEEPITVYFLPDADAAGTRMYQALVEATITRPGRKMAVVNLGLEPWEAIAMGHKPETVQDKITAKGDSRAVGRYVEEYDRRHGADWAAWLQDRRVELNALTPAPIFISWLDRKMAEAGAPGKVVPPEQVLADELRDRALGHISDAVRDAILREGNFEGRVRAASRGLEELIEAMRGTLDAHVRDALHTETQLPWTAPIDHLARDLADDLAEPGIGV